MKREHKLRKFPPATVMRDVPSKYSVRILLGEMLEDKERLANEEQERLRLARRVARLWSWDYRADTDTVLWTIPEAHSDRTVQVTLEQVLSAVPADDRDRVSNAVQNTLNT